MSPDTSTVSEPTFRHLLRELIDDGKRLVSDEVELAQAEMKEKARIAGRQSLLIAVGAAVVLLGSIALFAALNLGLVHVLSNWMETKYAMWLGPLIIGLLAAGGGGLLAWRAIARLRRERLTPQRTMQSLRANGAWLMERLG